VLNSAPISNEITRVAIETLGCKLNQAESETLARELVEAGCRLVGFKEPASVYILNTCSVTHVADRKSRQMLRQAHRLSPQAKIVAIGCYAGVPGQQPGDIEGIDLIVDNTQKAGLIKILRQRGWIRQSRAEEVETFQNRTRSFIKAQDGCDNFCAYCIVPIVRGREKSLPPEQVIEEIRQRVNEGYQEAVLTGTEIGRYNAASTDIAGLARRILAETAIRRLRLSSLQPPEITPELVGLWQNGRLCRHFHLSLQSGSDSVLKRMNRKYSAEQYAEKVTYLRVLIPEVSITTDVIVGFPGETEYEFQESYEFCRRMNFSRTHVFSYSNRVGTTAAGMPRQLPAEIKKQRSNQMIALGQVSLAKYNNRFLGTWQEVLFEHFGAGFCSGYTDTYIKVYIKNRDDLSNQLIKVKLARVKDEGMEGELISNSPGGQLANSDSLYQ
jgi:threonylcarbamoyladenosine tRNA methylthiotransferase MtaB